MHNALPVGGSSTTRRNIRAIVSPPTTRKGTTNPPAYMEETTKHSYPTNSHFHSIHLLTTMQDSQNWRNEDLQKFSAIW